MILHIDILYLSEKYEVGIYQQIGKNNSSIKHLCVKFYDF